jgi:hypothetical protein
MYDKTKVLKIDLKTWDYGKRFLGIPKLRNTRGMKCCLGFECELRGIYDFLDVPMPRHLKSFVSDIEVLDGLVDLNDNYPTNSHFSELAAHFNDVALGGNFVTTAAGSPYPCWVDASGEVKTEILKITNKYPFLSNEDERQKVIAYLFNHYLNRTVEFIPEEI